MRWYIHGRTPDERSQRAFRSRLLRMPIWQRLDTVLIPALILLLVLAIVSLFSVISYGKAQGWFDAPVVQPLEDERILYNVRDHLEDYALLDAIFHAPDNHVYIAQEGNIIYRYDPATHLWSNEKPFPKEEAIAQNFIALRSGCGTDPDSFAAADCPDPDSIWALGADGSLARRKNGRWQIVVSNSAFIGADGNRVEHEDLTTAAVSGDNRWLILGTNGKGIGIYDITQSRWYAPSPEMTESLPSLEITHLVWWDGAVWIGTPAGLARLDVKRRTVTPIEDVPGEILDIDAEENGSLWVLENRSCQEKGDKCLWLGKFRESELRPETVIDQRNNFPELSLADLNFAQQRDDTLILAGKAGIYGYDTNLHAWHRLFEAAVNIVLPERDGNGFYFGYSKGIGHVSDSVLQAKWDFPNEGIVKLLFGQMNEILALTDAGNLYGVSTVDGSVNAVYEAGSTARDPKSFTMAAAIGRTILFFGPEGGLLHDVEKRTYEDVPADALPAWLTDPNSHIILAGDNVYIVAEGSSSKAMVYMLPADQAVSASFYVGGYADDIQPQSVPGPIERVWKWGEQSIGVLAGDGSIYRFTTKKKQVTGGAVPALDNIVLRDVASFSGDLVFSVGDALWRYNLAQREWRSSKVAGRYANESIDELAATADGLLMRTSNGRLITDDGWALIGDTPGIGISDADLSDAWDTNSMLYLAGAGRVEAYDYDARKIAEVWKVADRGDVAIKGLINGRPLIHIDGRAALGDALIDPEAGEVVTVSADDHTIWTVRRDRGALYLKGHDISAPNNQQEAICYFRNASAGSDVTKVYDARELNDGLVAVATNAGIRFYDPHARSWFAAPDKLLQANRLYLLGDQLLLVEGQENDDFYRLSFVDTNSVRVPHSCSASERVALQATQALFVRAVAVQEAVGRAAWIGTDRAVTEWRKGTETELLAAVGDPPPSNALRRTFNYSNDGHLLFTTDRDIWRYDLQKRFWSRIQLNLQGRVGALRDINIERNGENRVVAVTTASGDMYWGEFSDGDHSVDLERIFTANLPRFGETAGDLLDVQVRDRQRDAWTFVLRDKIKYFDPLRRTWRASQDLPADASYSFQEALGRGILVGENGNVWQIATRVGATPETFVPYHLYADDQDVAMDSKGQVWRLTAAGEIQRCRVVQGRYKCEAYREPMLLSPQDVVHAFKWRDFIVFETDAGLRAFNQSSGEEYGLGQEVRTFSGITFSHPYQDRLFFYSRQDERVLVLDSNLAPVDLEQISDFIVDGEERPWAFFDGDWHWFDGRGFRSLSEKAVEDVRVFVRNSAPVVVLGDDLVPWSFENEKLVGNGLPLPKQIRPDQIEFLAKDGDAWFVFSDGLVSRFESDVCYPPALPSPPLKETELLTSTVALTSTSAVTGTLAPTPTPTLTPIPTPTPVPCLVLRTKIPIAVHDIVWVTVENGSLRIVDADGRTLRITRTSDGTYEIDDSVATDASQAYPLKDDWFQLQANVKRLPHGETAYDPVVALDLRSQRLLARRQTGSEELLADQAVKPKSKTEPFTVSAALDAGWLRWDRDSSTFSVSTGQGHQEFSKTDFIRNGRLIFENANAVLVVNSRDFQITNEYGIWVFKQPDLNLNSDVTFYPVDLPTDISAAHGTFVTSSKMISVGHSRLATNAVKYPHIIIGDVEISENIRERTISGAVSISGQQADSFVTNGFLWDERRQGIAYDGVNLLLQSDAGIHPLNEILIDFDAGPEGLGTTGGILQSTATGEMHLFDSNSSQWYRRYGGRWQTVSNPYLDRSLLNNRMWTWRFDGGSLHITLAGNAHDFSFVEHDLNFSSDQLLAAASVSDKLVVATNAFLEIAADPAELQSLRAVRIDPIQSDRFDIYHFADGRLDLFNYLNGETFHWELSQNRFSPASSSSDPAKDRPLIENNHLRFTLRSGEVDKELQLNRFQGGSNWAAFSFYEQRFPFDYVTALAVFDGELYVGTRAGLTIFPNEKATNWHDVTAVFDMRKRPSDQLAPVTRLGTPTANDDLLMAAAQDVCVERSTSVAFKDCRKPGLLDELLRLKSVFWQWHRDPADHLIGHYVNADNTLSTEEIHVTRGRLPNDHIQDVSVCESHAFTLWKDKWVTVHGREDFQIGHLTHNFLFEEEKLARLICVNKRTPLTHAAIEPGAYLESTEGKVWRFQNQRWQPLSDEELISGIRDYVSHPPLFQSQRLRLPAEKNNLMFEQRALSGEWLEVPWRLDEQSQTWQIGIDNWRQIVDFDGVIWVSTPQGFINVERRSGQARIDPDALTIIREPLTPEDAACNVTDLDVLDGKVIARCEYDSKEVYEGVLTKQRDRGVFSKMTSADPFAVQTLIPMAQTNYWEWRMSGREGGRTGHLSGLFYDEDIRLVGGTFPFDTINSLAFFQKDKIEIGTRLGGWRQSHRTDLGIEGFARLGNKIAKDVSKVWLARVDEALALCLQLTDGNYVRILLDGSEENLSSCQKYLGNDGLWTYASEGGILDVRAYESIGGLVARNLTQGRFTDDIVEGLPATGSAQGRVAYLIPTSAGVLEFDQSLSKSKIYGGPFLGLKEGSSPRAVFWFDGDTPAYAGQESLYSLDAQRQLLGKGLFTHFDNRTILELAQGYHGLLYIFWTSRAGDAGWALIDPQTLQTMQNGMTIDISALNKFQRKRLQWGMVNSTMSILFDDDKLTILFGSADTLIVPLPPEFELVTPILYKNRILLIGRRDLLELNLESAIVSFVQVKARSQKNGLKSENVVHPCDWTLVRH